MTTRGQRLLDEAKALSELERAEIAAALLASLPPQIADRDDAAWIEEIERRALAALSGESGLSWNEVREEVERRLGKR